MPGFLDTTILLYCQRNKKGKEAEIIGISMWERGSGARSVETLRHLSLFIPVLKQQVFDALFISNIFPKRNNLEF